MKDEHTFRMDLQYDGSSLHGWAKQPGLPTVEGYLERALTTAVGRPPWLRVAGRTDAGVHARRQVVSLDLPKDTDPRRLLTSLNALTPPCIAVTRLTRASAGFDARKDAISRTYRYHLFVAPSVSPFWKPYCWWLAGPVDLRAVREAASLVVGKHDFSAFTPTLTEHTFFNRRVLGCAWKRSREGVLVLEIEAESYLRHMVRVLVGTMVEVGLGKRSLEDLRVLLSGAHRDHAGLTAPAQGLFLWDVKY